MRILDYLDLHYYLAASGVALSSAGDSTTQALRLRSTRSLWDPSYIDESWISNTASGGVAVRLIPRMKEWVDANYRGTKLAVSEYNWGALDNINGALAQADVLGIFGREGLDLATLWGPPADTDPGAFAFLMYRNYDGAGSGFGDVSTEAVSADQDTLSVYAAQRSSDGALTVMVINKTSGALTSTVSLSRFHSAADGGRLSVQQLTAGINLARGRYCGVGKRLQRGFSGQFDYAPGPYARLHSTSRIRNSLDLTGKHIGSDREYPAVHRLRHRNGQYRRHLAGKWCSRRKRLRRNDIFLRRVHGAGHGAQSGFGEGNRRFERG